MSNRKQKPRKQLYLIELDDGSTDMMLLREGLKVGDRVWLEWARAYVTVKWAAVLAENAQISAAPVYLAYVSGTCVEVGDSLEELLATLRKDSALCDEDVAVWREGRIAALLMHDGAVVYLEGSAWIDGGDQTRARNPLDE